MRNEITPQDMWVNLLQDENIYDNRSGNFLRYSYGNPKMKGMKIFTDEPRIKPKNIRIPIPIIFQSCYAVSQSKILKYGKKEARWKTRGTVTSVFQYNNESDREIRSFLENEGAFIRKQPLVEIQQGGAINKKIVLGNKHENVLFLERINGIVAGMWPRSYTPSYRRKVIRVIGDKLDYHKILEAIGCYHGIYLVDKLILPGTKEAKELTSTLIDQICETRNIILKNRR